MSEKPKLLWISDVPPPPHVRAAAGQRWGLLSTHWDHAPVERIEEAQLVVFCPNGQCQDTQLLAELLVKLDHTHAVAVIMLPDEAENVRHLLADRHGRLVCVSDRAGQEELAAKFAVAAELQPIIADLYEELSRQNAQRQGPAGAGEELDEQLRLAARLQRDFMPRRLPEVGPARFGVLFRPARWVSGDIYDIMRLDETHIGFYVVDVVGHGMPAALMTMFIKKALQTKRIAGHTYQIVPPHVSLGELNTDICQQELSSCQFCTAVYCVLETDTLTLTYARAGHPESFIVHPNGSTDVLASPGSLLGVFPEETFESATVRLSPGDRLVLYSDGAEEAFADPQADSARSLEFARAIAPWSALPREEMLLHLTASLDVKYGHTQPQDDITVLVLDIERQADSGPGAA